MEEACFYGTAEVGQSLDDYSVSSGFVALDNLLFHESKICFLEITAPAWLCDLRFSLVLLEYKF